MGRNGYADHPPSWRERGLPSGETSISSLSGAEEQRLRRRLRGWAQHRLGVGGEDFDDMYQAAWLAVTESNCKEATRGLEHHLRWALERRWYNELRRRERRPTASLDEVAEAQLSAPAETDPCEQLERLEATRYLLEAFDGLTERQWRLVLLVDLWGDRPAKVRAALGVSARTYRREHTAALANITVRVGELLEGAWCEDHADLMAAFATGHATDEETQGAQRHLTNCLACRRTVIEHRCPSGTATAPASGPESIEMAASRASGDLST